MHDLGLYGTETCRGQRYRYQAPLNLLIYRSLFGNCERATDSFPDIFPAVQKDSQARHLSCDGREIEMRAQCRKWLSELTPTRVIPL